MFARVTHMRSKPERLAELTALYHDSVMPVIRLQPGDHSTLRFTDPATGKGLSIAVWQSAADLNASESTGFLREQVGKVMHLFSGPPLQDAFMAEMPVWV